jgi:acetyl-CoA carboxylase carboxyl transferase subunit alpha
VPVVSAIVGEGGSGGAVALAVSMMPKLFRSCAVTRIASAASAALSAVRHRIEAKALGDLSGLGRDELKRGRAAKFLAMGRL